MSLKEEATTVDNRDPDIIRQEIDEATANLTETLDALQGKLQPEALVAEAKEKALDGVSNVRDILISNARRHPVAASLIGLGAVWLLGRSFIGGKAQVGGGVFSFALGAAVGIGAYRAMVSEQHIDDDEVELLGNDAVVDEGKADVPAVVRERVAVS